MEPSVRKYYCHSKTHKGSSMNDVVSKSFPKSTSPYLCHPLYIEFMLFFRFVNPPLPLKRQHLWTAQKWIEAKVIFDNSWPISPESTFFLDPQAVSFIVCTKHVCNCLVQLKTLTARARHPGLRNCTTCSELTQTFKLCCHLWISPTQGLQSVEYSY